jgi:hypothetical protein
MAPDGEYVSELTSASKEECIERSADMGSRWIFYPYHFILTDSGLSVIEPPDTLEHLRGKRLTTVVKAFQYYMVEQA